MAARVNCAYRRLYSCDWEPRARTPSKSMGPSAGEAAGIAGPVGVRAGVVVGVAGPVGVPAGVAGTTGVTTGVAGPVTGVVAGIAGPVGVAAGATGVVGPMDAVVGVAGQVAVAAGVAGPAGMASDVAGTAHGADSAGAAGLGGLRAGARTGAGELPLAAAEDSARPSSANCTSRVPVRPAARTPAATAVPCHRTATSRCSSSCKSQMMSATVVVSSAS